MEKSLNSEGALVDCSSCFVCFRIACLLACLHCLPDIEPRLIEPTFVYDYPSSQAAFATVRGEIAERFELYMNGVELANAFTELLDAFD